MTVVNIHAAKTHLSRLVDRAAKGEEIVIARAGKPVARLVACDTKPKRRVPGQLKGRIEYGDDFDEPLPEMIAALNQPIEPRRR
jgi:prevent-host-death family protein